MLVSSVHACEPGDFNENTYGVLRHHQERDAVGYILMWAMGVGHFPATRL
jgi:hypothetical protein